MYVAHLIHTDHVTTIRTRNIHIYWEQDKKTSSSKDGNKCLISRTSIFSTSIAAKSYLDFIFLTLSILMHRQYSHLKRMKKDEEVDVEINIHDKPISCTMDIEGFYQHPQKPKLD